MTAPNPPRPITIRRHGDPDRWVVKSPAQEGWCYEIQCPTWTDAIIEAEQEVARLCAGDLQRRRHMQLTYLRSTP